MDQVGSGGHRGGQVLAGGGRLGGEESMQGGKEGPPAGWCAWSRLQARPALTIDSQDPGHSGGADRPGSMDRAGPDPHHAGREQHALGLPAVAPGAVGAAATRLHAAAHVGASHPHTGPRLGGSSSPRASPGHAALHLQGLRFPGRHRGPGTRGRHVPRRELWRRNRGELRGAGHWTTGEVRGGLRSPQ